MIEFCRGDDAGMCLSQSQCPNRLPGAGMSQVGVELCHCGRGHCPFCFRAGFPYLFLFLRKPPLWIFGVFLQSISRHFSIVLQGQLRRSGRKSPLFGDRLPIGILRCRPHPWESRCRVSSGFLIQRWSDTFKISSGLARSIVLTLSFFVNTGGFLSFHNCQRIVVSLLFGHEDQLDDGVAKLGRVAGGKSNLLAFQRLVVVIPRTGIGTKCVRSPAGFGH